jgi:hypothetical protein
MNARFVGNPRFIIWFVLFVLILGTVGGGSAQAAAFTSSEIIPPQSVLAVLPTVWSPLNDKGLSNSVNAIAVYGTNVYVGGDFTQSYDGNTTGLYYIARYDTVSGTWHAMGIGLNNSVRAIAVGAGGVVYVGGDFTGLSDNSHPELKHIAKFNGVSWSPLFTGDLGLNGSVLALAYDAANSDLWVGGSFNDQVNTPHLGLFQHIARFNTLGTVWNATQCNGLSSDVSALVVSGSNIYVGGAFSQTANATATCTNADKTHLNKIAKYSGGTSWTALAGYGISGLGVNALAADAAGNIYVGGSFASTYTNSVTNMNNFGIYSAGAWVSPSTFRNGINNTSGGNVNALAVIGTDLYVGGTFTKTADNAIGGLNNLAIYRANNWVAAPGNGLQIAPVGGSVDAIAYTGIPTLYNIYAGGAFDSSGDGLTINLKSVAALANACNANGSGNWNSVGTWSCGEVPTSADQVTIPNGVTVTLNADATINGKLTLNGILDGSVSGKTLTLGPNSTLVGAGEILGTVQRIAPAIGAALAYNNLATKVTFYGSSPSSLKVKLIKGNPGPGVLSSHAGRTYVLTPTGAFGFASLQLAYKTSELFHITNQSNLKLWRYDIVLKKWVLQGGTVDTVNHFVSLSNVTQFSSWTFFDNPPSYKVYQPFMKK